MKYIVNLAEINLADVARVGGKNASTGELIQNLSKQGINVPGGFATTVESYQTFLFENHLEDKIKPLLNKLKINNIAALDKTSAQIRRWILAAPFNTQFENEIATAYRQLKNATVAVRSSATTEDLATASFAGQQESYLNIKGIKNLIPTIKHVYASLFTSRALAYRETQGFNHLESGISVGVQPMIRSDKGASGVMFTLDTESGFDKVVLITGTYGLGEAIVQGHVIPDEFYVYKTQLANDSYPILQRKLGNKKIKMIFTSSTKPNHSIKTVSVKPMDQSRFCIDDNDIQSLTDQALRIEKHYGQPMDIEWAKDGLTGDIYIVQARPETVKSQALEGQSIERYSLNAQATPLISGQSIGQRIASGTARIILNHKKMNAIKPGEVLVTDMTDPDWEPIMKRASAIVTNRGGRTCHAAIIARELGIPAVIGCNDATTKIKDGQTITVSCADGQTGYVYPGHVPFNIKKTAVDELPPLPVDICMNVGNPEIAFQAQSLPNKGVGLARLEFIISHMIGIHPNAILNWKKLPKKLKNEITLKTSAYKNPTEFYIAKLTEGIATIAAAFYPKQVIFRFSDFKTNEYANLLGGDLYEPHEENPMIGFRGASRYKDPRFEKCFELECLAFKRVREQLGLTNAQVMIPFVRTVDELKQVINLIESFDLIRGVNNLKIFMMCEIPSNVILASDFLQYVDGYSIGSNDLTQLMLGLDRDSNIVASLFDERNPAIKQVLRSVIAECNIQGKYIGICGQGPSDHPDFAVWLMEEGIQSMSLNPDTVIETWTKLAKLLAEKKTEETIQETT